MMAILEKYVRDPAAMHFCRQILTIVSIYDDLIDGDMMLTPENVHDCMWSALVELPRNPFYRQNFEVLNPAVMMAVLNWRAANAIEDAKNKANLPISFIIRSSYADIFGLTVMLCCGPDVAAKATEEFRLHVHDEGLESYTEEMS